MDMLNVYYHKLPKGVFFLNGSVLMLNTHGIKYLIYWLVNMAQV